MAKDEIAMVEVGWSEGVVVAVEDVIIRFDPHKMGGKIANSFISHAHLDHAAGFSSHTSYSTAETKDIITLRLGRKIDSINLMKYGEKIQIDDLEITAYNAGHMLGSAQFEVKTPEATIVYTGDINCIDTLTTKAAESRKCDLLIIETTYGNPYYVFPNRYDIYTKIMKWVLEQIRNGRTPIFRVYAAGKAQEIIRLINVFTHIPVVTHPIITKICDIHNKNGMHIDYTSYETTDGQELINSHQGVYIVPSGGVINTLVEASSAVTTGWAIRYNPHSMDVAFPLSSHADFNQLTNYVREANPKKVYTVHGFKEIFSKYLSRKKGINATPIATMPQRSLQEFIEQ